MVIIQTHWLVRFNDWLYCEAFELSSAVWDAEMPKHSEFFMEGLKSRFSFLQTNRTLESLRSDSDFIYGNYRASQLDFEEDFREMSLPANIAGRLQSLFEKSATPDLTALQKQQAAKHVTSVFNNVFEDCEVLYEFNTFGSALSAKKHPAEPYSIFWSVIGFSHSRKRVFYLEIGDH
jgi:hypothetical protein